MSFKLRNEVIKGEDDGSDCCTLEDVGVDGNGIADIITLTQGRNTITMTTGMAHDLEEMLTRRTH